MLTYPTIDPVIFALGPVKLHWYGLMYLIGFVAAWQLGKWRAQRADTPINPAQMEDLVFYGAIGVIVGGRLGSVFFYNFEHFLADPTYLLRIWQGGMSFHGGFLGVLVAMEVYRRKHNLSFWDLTDFIAPFTAVGLGAGRIGNFINGELWGAPSDVPWAMKLSCVQFPPNVYSDFAGPLCLQARHPSQLYEFLLEGVALFIILWWFSRKARPRMAVSALFLIGYGLFRTLVEWFRLPDAHIGYLLGSDWLTMGMVLSAPMWIIGIGLLFWAYRHPAQNKNHEAVS